MKKVKANKALALALKVAKPNDPVFSAIMLTGEHLLATNDVTALELDFPVDLDFPVVVDGTDLKNAIAGLRDKEVSFEYKYESIYINGKVRVPLLEDNAFTKMPHVGLKKESGCLRLSGSFSQLYKETTPHRSKDQLRPNMMRAYLSPDGAMWATNAHTAIMIANVVTSHDSDMLDCEKLPAHDRGIQLPTLPCEFLPDATIEAYIAPLTSYQYVYVIEDAEKKFYFKRCEGEYPLIPSVVPSREMNNVFMTVDADALRDTLLEAIAAVKIGKKGVEIIATFTQRDNGIEVEAIDIDMGKSYSNLVPASFNKVDEFTDDIRIGADMTLFSNCLASFKGQTIEIGFSSPKKAICFYSTARPELTMICMPFYIEPIEE